MSLIELTTLPDSYWLVRHKFKLPQEWDWNDLSSYCDMIEAEAKRVHDISPIFVRYDSDTYNVRPYHHARREDVKALEMTWCLLREEETKTFAKMTSGRIEQKDWPEGLTDTQKIERWYDVVLLGR